MPLPMWGEAPRACSVAATNRREIADLEVPELAWVTCSQLGSWTRWPCLTIFGGQVVAGQW